VQTFTLYTSTLLLDRVSQKHPSDIIGCFTEMKKIIAHIKERSIIGQWRMLTTDVSLED